MSDRKDRRDKNGNDQKVPLLSATGFDAWAILEEQKSFSGRSNLIFPYNGRSVGTAFRRGCMELRIKDLKFHDLRHEAARRLFEAGFTIEQTTLVTGHKDWKMLKLVHQPAARVSASPQAANTATLDQYARQPCADCAGRFHAPRTRQCRNYRLLAPQRARWRALPRVKCTPSECCSPI